MLHQLLHRSCVHQLNAVLERCLCRKFSTNYVARITWNIKWANPARKPEAFRLTSTYFLDQRKFIQLSQRRFMHRDDFRIVDNSWNKRDSVSEEFTLVYDVNISSNLRLAMLLPLTIMMIISAGIVVSAYVFGVEFPENLPETSVKTRHVLYILTICLFTMFLVPAVKNLNRSILRIYNKNNSDDFIAIIRKNFTGQEHLPFKKFDAKGYFGRGSKGNFVIKGRSFMVYEEDFAKFGNQILFNDWFGSYVDTKR